MDVKTTSSTKNALRLIVTPRDDTDKKCEFSADSNGLFLSVPFSSHDDASLFYNTASAIRMARSTQYKSWVLDLELCTPEKQLIALESALMAGYHFETYCTDKKSTKETLYLRNHAIAPQQISQIKGLIEGVALCRDLGNENAHVATPEYLAKTAKGIAKDSRCTLTVLGPSEMKKLGMGLLLAVGGAYEEGPRLIAIHYKGNDAQKNPIALVGKGITFDTGGLNLKPSGNIEAMRLDMAGAATVLGTIQALVATDAAVNVVGVVAAACNGVDSKSYFPGDIYKGYAGKTVEICNTDAEGRLVLADALSWTEEQFAPQAIIDLATLTGGVLSTFADRIGALLSTDHSLARELFLSGESTFERVWQLPLYDEYKKSMKGDRSDLRNLSTMKRGHASTITAAAFLSYFIEKTPWAHLDIAGVAINESEARGPWPKWATGWGVRLLCNYLKNVEKTR